MGVGLAVECVRDPVAWGALIQASGGWGGAVGRELACPARHMRAWEPMRARAASEAMLQQIVPLQFVDTSGFTFALSLIPGVPEDGGGRGVEEAGGSCCRAADLDRIFLAANFEEDKTTEESKVRGCVSGCVSVCCSCVQARKT